MDPLIFTIRFLLRLRKSLAVVTSAYSVKFLESSNNESQFVVIISDQSSDNNSL